MPSPPLGAHVSAAGGLERAIERGEALGCEALQVFVKNPSQWRGKALDETDAVAFRTAHRRSAIGPLVAHGTYLVNLAATDRSNLSRSRRATVDELSRCRAAGIGELVVHPGAHLGAGEEQGLARIAASLDAVLATRESEGPRILLEITAGQGTVVGYRLEHLAVLRERCAGGDRLGLCLDTCHAFAAGYAIHEERGYEELMGEIEDRFGWAALGCIHLNDSQRGFASRRDRHANIGEGEIGLATFERLLADERLAAVPMILETPLGDDGGGHARDLERLRALRSAGG